MDESSIEIDLRNVLCSFTIAKKWNKKHLRYNLETLISHVNSETISLTSEEYEIYAAIKTLYNIAKE